MKVALVHDYIKEYGGAERVLEALHEIYPDAPVFTSVYIPSFLGPHRERFARWDIRTSILQHIPFKHKLISPFRMFSPWVFKQFDLSDYDLVIVSATGAYEPNMVRTKNQEPRTKNNKGAIHICYCHTPPRYLYGYATARDWKRHRIFAVLGAVFNHFLRMVDFAASRHVDFYIANSEEVAGRIKKFYRSEATVIYPPVEIQNSKLQIKNQKGMDSRLSHKGTTFSEGSRGNDDKRKDYFLTGGRLAMAKHFDLIVRACRELDVPLKVFGKSFAGYGEKLEDLAGRKTEFFGEVSDEEKFKLMAGAKAFLFASEDEDFGIVPVEAMGCGIPVIAYKSGGVKETVIEGKTGVFFEELTAESFKKAIQKFEKMKFDPYDSRKQAQKFSKERFDMEFKEFVKRLFSE